VIQLLQKSKSWIDPNLLLLGENSAPNRSKQPKKEACPKQHSLDLAAESDDDSFAALRATKIALKRSSDVSDASDDDDSDKNHDNL